LKNKSTSKPESSRKKSSDSAGDWVSDDEENVSGEDLSGDEEEENNYEDNLEEDYENNSEEGEEQNPDNDSITGEDYDDLSEEDYETVSEEVNEDPSKEDNDNASEEENIDLSEEDYDTISEEENDDSSGEDQNNFDEEESSNDKAKIMNIYQNYDQNKNIDLFSFDSNAMSICEEKNFNKFAILELTDYQSIEFDCIINTPLQINNEKKSFKSIDTNKFGIVNQTNMNPINNNQNNFHVP